MRALILGGTAFLGVHLTDALAARGHDVTHFNRGVTRPKPPSHARSVRGDRTRGFDILDGERFDVVIDTSGYLPHVVERSARFFSSRADRYIFVSSISVYDVSKDELDETSPMPTLPEGASNTEITAETYGALKALCERVVARTFRHRATIVRPGLICGPEDPTDRFTYWPIRFERGGRILAPGMPQRAVQFVGARDLASFIVLLAESGASGDYNVTSPQDTFSMGDVMSTCAQLSRTPSSTTWVDDEFLMQHEVAPWMEIPLWIPPNLGIPGLLNVNVRKALAAGLTIRPISETARDTLAWASSRPQFHALLAGLTPEREASLLGKFDLLDRPS